MRLGPGPVFAYEWLTAARRWQTYAIRAGFVGAILVGMALLWNGLRGLRAVGPDGRISISDAALFGRNLYEFIAWIELLLVLLAAPAATAGAICLDRARGTLDHMLVTELSSAEIVLGKLGVRLIPALGLIAATMPVLALASLLGGIDPMAMVALLLTATGCALVGCALALALSVYGRKTHEVVMMTYVLILAWVLASPILEIVHFVIRGGFPPPPGGGNPWSDAEHWLTLSNPFWLAVGPYSTPDAVDGTTYLGFLAGCLAVSSAPVILAMARVRRVALTTSVRRPPRARPRLRLPGPSLDRDPVAWREWHRARPSLMMRIAWGLYAALGMLWVFLASRAARGIVPGDAQMVGTMNLIHVSIGLVLLSASSSSSLAEERARGSLDVLLSTPLPTRSILAGKWRGSFRRTLNVVIWPAATTAFLAAHGGYWAGYLPMIGMILAHGAAITSLGLAVATWVRRPGRAVATCVSAHILGVIGWPILLAFIMSGRPVDTFGQGLLAGDPPIGVMLATEAISDLGFRRAGDWESRGEVFFWISGWAVVLAVVAAGLFLAALATFDRCLGRIPDDGRAPTGAR